MRNVVSESYRADTQTLIASVESCQGTHVHLAKSRGVILKECPRVTLYILLQVKGIQHYMKNIITFITEKNTKTKTIHYLVLEYRK